MSVYDEDRKKYEVNGVMNLENSNDCIPQEVRVLELTYPTGAFNNSHGAQVRPLIETQEEFIRPLLNLVAKQEIPAPGFNEAPAHRLRTDSRVFRVRHECQCIFAGCPASGTAALE